MSDDAFLGSLRSDWRGATPDPALILRDMARHRRWRRRVIVANALAVPLLLACCLWFALAAIHDRDALQGVSALAYAMAIPVVVAELITLFREGAAMAEPSPLGVIQLERARAALSRRLLASGRWSARILVAATLALWALAAVGSAGVADAALLSVAWCGTAAAIWLWIARRDAELARILATCDGLLAQFRAAEDWRGQAWDQATRS